MAHSNAKVGSRSLAVIFAVALVPLLILWFFAIRPYYYPSGDEIALLTSSARMFYPHPSLWFTQGYSRYFLAYAGAPHTTNFIRPVANAAYLLNSLLFGANWPRYLLFTYAVQAGLVTVGVLCARRFLCLGRNGCWVVGVLVFLSPACELQELVYPSFAFDLLGALLVLCGLLCLWEQRYNAGWVLLTVALFTKESTLFAPVVTATLVLFGWRVKATGLRRVGYALCWLAPLAFWWAVRHHAFGHATDGIYVLPTLKASATAKGVVHGLLAWPFGMRTVNQGHWPQIVLFLLNACFWCTGVYMLRQHRKLSTREQLPVPPLDQSSGRLALGAYLLGALALPVLLSLPLRFGACFFPLFTLFLVSTVTQAGLSSVRKWAIATLILLGLDGIYQKIVEPLTFASLRSTWQMSASQVAALGQAPSGSTVLLFDDATGGLTTTDLIGKFAHFEGDVIRLTNLEGLAPARCQGQPETHAARNELHLQLLSRLSASCGYYAFDGLPPELATAPHARQIRQSAVDMAFLLPGVAPLHAAGTPQMTGDLQVDLTGLPEHTAILVPDFSGQRYRWLPVAGMQ